MTENLATGALDPDAYRHHARILQAQHYARPVWFNGKEEFVQVASSRLAGGRIQMDVYFTGNPTAIDSALIQIEHPTGENQ